MKLKKFYEIATEINKSMMSVAMKTTNQIISISIDVNQLVFKSLKNDINKTANYLEEKKEFDNSKIILHVEGIEFQIINIDRVKEIEYEENLIKVTKELVKRKIDISKVFFVTTPSFQIVRNVSKKNASYFLPKEFILSSADLLSSKRRLLIEKNKNIQELLRYYFFSLKKYDEDRFNNNLGINISNYEILPGIKFSDNLESVTFGFPPPEMFDQEKMYIALRKELSNAALGVFLYVYPINLMHCSTPENQEQNFQFRTVTI